MNTYTDQNLLDTAGAVGLLPDLPLMGPTTQDRTEADTGRDIGNGSRRVVAPTVAPATGKTCQTGSQSDKIGNVCGRDETGAGSEKTPQNTNVLRGFQGVVRAGLENVLKSRGNDRVSDQLAQSLAQFKVGSLWEALEDTDRATLFAVAVAMIERAELSPRTGDGR